MAPDSGRYSCCFPACNRLVPEENFVAGRECVTTRTLTSIS